VQSSVDCALAAFAAAHKLDINIFLSDEWEDLLESINQGPLPDINTVYEAVPTMLLARAAIHQVQASGRAPSLVGSRRESVGVRPRPDGWMDGCDL
jgi:hypothetical protein